MTSSETTYPYQDATLSVDQRVEDLLSRMTLEDKAGLMFHQMGMVGELDAPGLFGKPSMRSMLDKGVSHFNTVFVPSAREIAQWNNVLQDAALARPLGVPVTISSDPRHAFTNNPFTSLMSGPFSQWPEPLGFAAIGSSDLLHEFADLTRREYLAVGIRTALHPQVDLATEPRWARTSGTFGEDVDLTTRLGVAYILGLQGDEVGPHSVSAMVKHFPGGGPQKDGEDPHFAYGREQVYPAGRFDLHLEPFVAAIAAGAAQMMPYYGMPVGTEYEEVGFSFNKAIITGLLREDLGYDGIVCTDWGILGNTCWGVEHLTYEERMLKAVDAGVDQFGGESSTEVLVGLVKAGKVSESRIEASARRVLREKFRLGLFENPYVDAASADALVGSDDARARGVAAQAAAHTLLKNAGAGAAHLPLTGTPRLYVEGLSVEAIGDRALVVDNPEEADVAVLRLSAPFESRGEQNSPESFFHAGSLAFPAEDVARIAAICASVPTVIDVYLDRPALLGDIEPGSAALIANFGASEEAFVQVLFGEATPQGNLPFDIPSSMVAVEASAPDAPFDTVDPTYRHGFGLRYA